LIAIRIEDLRGGFYLLLSKIYILISFGNSKWLIDSKGEVLRGWLTVKVSKAGRLGLMVRGILEMITLQEFPRDYGICERVKSLRGFMTLKLLGSFKQRVNSVKGLGVMGLPFTEWNYILKKG